MKILPQYAIATYRRNYQTAVNNRAMVTRIPEDGRGRSFPSSGRLLQQFTRDDDPVMQIKLDVDGRVR